MYLFQPVLLAVELHQLGYCQSGAECWSTESNKKQKVVHWVRPAGTHDDWVKVTREHGKQWSLVLAGSNNDW